MSGPASAVEEILIDSDTEPDAKRAKEQEAVASDNDEDSDGSCESCHSYRSDMSWKTQRDVIKYLKRVQRRAHYARDENWKTECENKSEIKRLKDRIVQLEAQLAGQKCFRSRSF